MKNKLTVAAAIVCAAICLLSFTACSPVQLAGECTPLGEPKVVEKIEYSALNTDGYSAFKNSVEAFASDFAAYSYADYDQDNNFTVSPISVYMALALSAECANGDTRNELLNALGVTYEQLQAHFSTLYRSLVVKHQYGNQTTGLLSLSNSVWVNNGTSVKQPCIDSLSNNFYAYSYSADFKHNNVEANKAIRSFVNKQTNGLIDKDFELSEETLFTLINTLYLKTIWSTDYEELPFAQGQYYFTANDGTVKQAKLLQGEYVSGRTQQFDTFATFYTRSHDGYKIKFIVPNDGYTLAQVFTSANISAVNSVTDYGSYDQAADTSYHTRVLFPEYKCEYDKDIADILNNNFGIDLFFRDPGYFSPACDFSTLSDEPCFCSAVRHVTDLTVNKKGIEGAAVTVVGMDAATAAPSLTVMEDFIVNKAFGFIITDWQDITLFSGVVNNI